MSGSTWIFGYGSLLWKQGFPFDEARPAFIRGWERRFWQGSTDHRGVPEAPGRVVTLVRSIGAVCSGLAFRLRGEDCHEVLSHLDHRERDGYQRIETDLFIHGTVIHGAVIHGTVIHGAADDGTRVPGLIYLADEANPSFLGPAPAHTIVEQIRKASGASGSNVEYVCRLAEALRNLGAADPHVFDLEENLTGLR